MRQNAGRDGRAADSGQDRATVYSAVERAMNSANKMSLLVNQQHDQLVRIAEQLRLLLQHRNGNQKKKLRQ
jgi:hypothetical protein